jgi:hypothetical protein
MADYDLDMVAPRPWKFINGEIWGALAKTSEGIYTGHVLVYAAKDDRWKGFAITDIMDEGDPHIKHIIHCVNHHDPLVKALEKFFRPYTEEDRKDIGRADTERLIALKQALAAAKGEVSSEFQSDDKRQSPNMFSDLSPGIVSQCSHRED